MNNSRYGSVCLRPRFLLPGLVVAAGLAVWLSASVFAQVPWAPPGARATAWAPGVQGGVPFRPTVCATLAAPAGDAAATINAALSACPAGQVVRLGAGTFTINNEIVFLRKGVTLRGAGLGADGKHLTVLKRTNGAQPGTYVPGPRPDPVVIMGSSRWTSAGTSANVSADAAKGATSVIVASGTYQPGQIVLVDELSGADWRTDPQGRGQVWASADFSVVWQRHNPGQGTDDPWPAANAWFSRADRPQAETHQVASFDAATGRLTFTTPLHKAFRASQAAQVYSYATQDAAVRGAGLEDVRVEGGGDGNVRMEGCVECWVARTENTTWLGEGVAVNRSFRCEVRDSYIHDGVWSVPGGGGYALSIGMGSAEVLVENNVIRKANKVMVARSSGAGSVVGYNYVDDGFIQGSEGWMEVGLNASHMVGPHHVLFEGNHGFNFDSDKTHGNSTYMTVFRNQLTGKRSGFADSGPKRAAGAAAYGYNMTYAGNVLGVPGMTGWAYESGNFNTPAIWLFGWDDWSPYPNDPGVKTSALREGNFDYATNSVRWDGTPTTLPSSLYLGAKPAFFGASTWPWVDSLGATKVYTLPAKARYDSGRPNVAPPSGPNPTPTPSPTATPSPTPTPPPPPPTPTPTPSPTPSPTSTPTPTPTPSPSPTPTPSPTPSPSPSPSPLLPADRSTVWAPGVRGIPVRSTICANVNATTFGNGTADASTGIQNAINACPANQVVQLSAGVFKVNTRFLQIAKGITLRGSGPLQTILRKTNGATPGSSQAPDQQPLVIVGPSRWPAPDNSTSRNLTVDGAKGGFAVTVSSGTGFAPGQFVLLDEDHYNTAAWTSLPPRNGQLVRRRIWASDRAVWMRHKPAAPEDDPFPEANGWFSRPGRPIAEIKEVSSVSGNTVTFTTPLHISYRTSKAAQLTRYTGTSVHVKSAGVEDLSVEGGSDGGVRFEAAAYSWARNIGNTTWLGDAVAVNDSFRVEVRDSYIHDAAFPNPGGFAFALSLAQGSSEVLVENNIVVQANKMMVARSAGAGSVVGYNYMDDGFIATDESWVEVGINGSHMVGAHHMLFEGNESFNYDSDDTHGNSIYHTVFRNRLTGFRSTYPGQAGARAAGLMYGSWWHSFVGNVLGKAGSMQGWVYEDLNAPWGGAAVWKLGYAPQHWEQDADAKVVSTVLRDGNFDYLTNVLHWASTPKALPNSLYLAGKPAFFGALTWPWVTPEGTQKLFTLPAKSRFVSGNPYGSPSELAPLSEE